MALSGNLSDMNVNDVLQLPTMGLRTGEMRIAHGPDTARLFYKEGQVVHVVLGDLRDEDALMDVQGWTEGEFVFQQGITPPAETIEEDLHRLLMRCAKKRDERQHKQAPPKGGVVLDSPEVRKAVEEAMATHQGFGAINFVSRDGKLLGGAAPTEAAVEQVVIAFAARGFGLADDAPRSAVKRFWLEDDDGHCLWLRLGAEVSLVILANPSVPMGSVMLAASKVGTTLKGIIGGGGS